MQRLNFKKYLILLFFNVISIVVILVGYRYIVNCYCPTSNDVHPSSQKVLKKEALNNIVENILEIARLTVKLELLDYNFTYSNVDKLEDLVMESGGRPVRNVIVSTWRSGSSFLGDLINSMPSNFYTYEPLMPFNFHQVREPLEGKIATSMIKKILECDYVGLEDYFTYAKFIKNIVNQIEFNKRVWNLCKYKEELCFDANFTTSICRLFPFQSVKLVRLRLSLVEDILANAELNAKVVLLVRDPRAVMNSRSTIGLCPKNKETDCSQPELLCHDMTSDYLAAADLLQKYPNKLMVLRYEDLILNHGVVLPELLNFLSFGKTKSHDEFLNTHTNVYNPNPFATFRISRNIPFNWMKSMDFDHVLQIQDKCMRAMELWGYQLAQNSSDMASKNFSPLLPYSVISKHKK